MTTATAPHRLWRNTRYLTWLVSDTSKGLAAALSGFAIPLLVLIVTDDPAQAGILAAVLAAAGRAPAGAPFVMGYDPPFAIPFLRRNEGAVRLPPP